MRMRTNNKKSISATPNPMNTPLASWSKTFYANDEVVRREKNFEFASAQSCPRMADEHHEAIYLGPP